MPNGLVHFLEEKEYGTITVPIATSVSLKFSLAHFASTSGCFPLEEACILKLNMYLSIFNCFAAVVGWFIIIMFKTFVVFFPVGYNRLRGICSKRPCQSERYCNNFAIVICVYMIALFVCNKELFEF